MSQRGLKRKRGEKHPYLSGNFAPIPRTLPLTPCAYTGTIPQELFGGEYVRNGANPVSNDDLGRNAHWFDGDGMLSGVIFQRNTPESSKVTPHFVNQYILTDLYLSSVENNSSLRTPILPSISTLVNPVSTLIAILFRIFRAAFLVLLSHLPGSQQRIKKISVANTNLLYHDGRALATCESGPPMRVQLPGLETVGWYDGDKSENEAVSNLDNTSDATFGGTGLLSWMREWTTGHPKIDPRTGEMVLFHCTFLAPYVHYSIIPSTRTTPMNPYLPKLLNAPVPRVSGAKMMHDFGVSQLHTVILDLPLSLDPLNLVKNQPIVSYDPKKQSRFGVFPRREPENVQWFETKGCCIFHTANTWDEVNLQGQTTAVHMLACRLTSATLVYSAGNITAPASLKPGSKITEEPKNKMSFFAKYDYDESVPFNLPAPPISDQLELDIEKLPVTETSPLLSPISESINDEEQCRLYHYTFSMTSQTPTITAQYALSSIPFEFPTLNPIYEMSYARYIYGCSTSSTSFGAALGKATKIDVLVKMDVQTLIQKAEDRPPISITGCVDNRSVEQILCDNRNGASSPIAAFKMPEGWFAQEARFVARENAISEDDGYLLFYAFDEAQLDSGGECNEDAVSELWIIDARDFKEVVAKVKLPQRVPYGLHGSWFSESEIRDQKPITQTRILPQELEQKGFWMELRRRIIRALG